MVFFQGCETRDCGLVEGPTEDASRCFDVELIEKGSNGRGKAVENERKLHLLFEC